MEKIYYQKSTKKVCYRFPNNLEPESENDYIEVEDDIANKTYQCPLGKIWIVEDNKPVLVDDEDLIKTDEYKKYSLDLEKNQLKTYLTDTDYIISKISEAVAEGDEELANELRTQYKEDLSKRKTSRARVKEIEEELNKLAE